VEQLRFNISEKIRLHPQQAGISSLLELDLYPDVEIKDEGQHLKIHGYLRLNGSYEGDSEAEVTDYDLDEQEGEEIAYVIPVEITLPRDRAELADVSAEVESFDYQLLSPFELQIEAVLMIDGILPEQEEELITEVSEDRMEEQEQIEESPTFAAQPFQPEFEEMKAIKEIPQAEEESIQRPVYRETRKITNEQPQEVQSQEEQQPQLAIEQDNQQEEVEELEEPCNTEDRGREWSRWMVGNKEDTFTPLRMVIVQKDESIDTLAAKYDISSDAILRTNQFTTDRLVEGQIVKIPVKRN
jgi:stage VI sporulation protein D